MSEGGNAGTNTGTTTGTGTTQGATSPSPTSGTPDTGSIGNSSVSDWTSTLTPEMRGFVQNKQFKDPSAVLESYVNLEKLHGVPQERLLKLPEKADAPEWNDIYGKLGKPSKADDYKIPMPEKGGDPEFVKWAKEAFHKANLTTKQAELVATKWNEYSAKQVQAQMEVGEAKAKAQEISLKKEWGAAFDQNMGIAKKAAVAFGVTADILDAIESSVGYDGAIKFMHTLGSKVGEHNFVSQGSSQGFGVNTPDMAKQRIQALRGDPSFVKDYTNGVSSARMMMEKLHKEAYPDS